jgi:hypothetical protein
MWHWAIGAIKDLQRIRGNWGGDDAAGSASNSRVRKSMADAKCYKREYAAMQSPWLLPWKEKVRSILTDQTACLTNTSMEHQLVDIIWPMDILSRIAQIV